jgi:hypothetical protein
VELKDIRTVVEAVLGDVADSDTANDVDIHKYVAQRMFRKNSPTMSERDLSKTTFFNLLYGDKDTPSMHNVNLFKREFPRLSRLMGLFEKKKSTPSKKTEPKVDPNKDNDWGRPTNVGKN